MKIKLNKAILIIHNSKLILSLKITLLYILGGYMKSQQELKHESKKLLQGHIWFYFVMYLPYLVLIIGAYLMLGYVHNWNFIDIANDENNLGMNIAIIIGQVFMVGISYVMMDIRRNKVKFDKPIEKAFTLFNKPKYLMNVIIISLLISIFTILWTFLFIIPGIIKAFSYSQALYIYKDSVDRGQTMDAFACITASRKMMDGRKMKLFWLQLSFIGWYILGIATAGILFVYVIPYYYQTMANFYLDLAENTNIKVDDSYL